jgi:hypothetical protein
MADDHTLMRRDGKTYLVVHKDEMEATREIIGEEEFDKNLERELKAGRLLQEGDTFLREVTMEDLHELDQIIDEGPDDETVLLAADLGINIIHDEKKKRAN